MSTARKPQTKSIQPNLRQRAAASRAAAASLLAQAAADEAAAMPVKELPEPAEIAARFDVAAMSMWELFSLTRVSLLVANICTAVSCQPRADADEPAGVLVRWIEDVFDAVVERSRTEAMGRKSEPGEACWRLEMIAGWIIAGGEDDEIAELALDVAAYAERGR